MLLIITSIDLADLLLFSARLLISFATTAKPLPASPALAASIDAFRASKFVWSVIAFIVSIISPILSASFPKFCVIATVLFDTACIECILFLTSKAFLLLS